MNKASTRVVNFLGIAIFVFASPLCVSAQSFPSLPEFSEFLDYSVSTTTPHVFDVAVIGDKYTDLEKFYNDSEKLKNAVLAKEPFTSHASELAFHVVNNKEDLGCTQTGSELIPAKCDMSAVLRVIKNSGVPADKIMIIVNGFSVGEAGRYIGIAGNGGMYAEELMVHEFGHLFGLLDEYVHADDGNGTRSNSCIANCCFSSACTEWAGIEGTMCIPGCGYSYWYRSSEDSIMQRSTGPGKSFNAISQKVIKKDLAQYINSALPSVMWDQPADNAVLRGVVQPVARIIVPEHSRLFKAEMFLDDILISSKTYYWDAMGYREEELAGNIIDTANLASGLQHTLFVKVYDFAGNKMVSLPLYFSVDNNLPAPHVLQPNSGSVNSNTANTGDAASTSFTDVVPAQDVGYPLPDTTPPVIFEIYATRAGPNPDNMTIIWRTNEHSTTDAEILSGFCAGENICVVPAMNPTYTKNHSMIISAIEPSKTYTFRVKSKDAAGNIVVSPIQSFIAPDYGFSVKSSVQNESVQLSGFKFSRMLKRGSTEYEVTLLQEFLSRSRDIYPEGLITGYFGTLTEAAVKKFQTKYGIASSGDPATTGHGLVGPRTRAKLNELYK